MTSSILKTFFLCAAVYGASGCESASLPATANSNQQTGGETLSKKYSVQLFAASKLSLLAQDLGLRLKNVQIGVQVDCNGDLTNTEVKDFTAAGIEIYNMANPLLAEYSLGADCQIPNTLIASLEFDYEDVDGVTVSVTNLIDHNDTHTTARGSTLRLNRVNGVSAFAVYSIQEITVESDKDAGDVFVDNRPPVAVDDTHADISENTPTPIPVLANDSDPDGDTLFVSSVSVPSNGTAFVAGNGSIFYVSDDDYVGPDSFTYTLMDSAGGTDVATISFDVIRPVTLNPVPDVYSLNETSIPVSGICSPNGTNNVMIDATDGSTSIATVTLDCSAGSWSTTIDLSSLAEGTNNITVTSSHAIGGNGIDVISKDTIAPTATLSGTPADPSMDTNLAVTVGGLDVVDYRYDLLSGGPADCSGASYSGGYIAIATDITDAIGTDNYRLCVIGRDAAGNPQASPTEFAWRNDTTPPPALDGFTGVKGSGAGEIDLSLNYPGSVADYDRIDIRRADASATAPADCSLGTIETTITTFAPDPTTYVDTGLSDDEVYSYRACIYDEAGNLTATNVAENIATNERPVFTTGAGLTADENQLSVADIDHTDADSDPVTYSIVGGADAAEFAINSTTGVLTFVSVKDYENPDDSDANGIYNVTIEIDDGITTPVTQAFTVTLQNVSEFVTTWRTTGPAETITLPLVASGSYNFFVDWGDGSNDIIALWSDTDKTHTYAVAGDYTVQISGTLTGWSFNNGGDKDKLRTISAWGPFRFGNSGNHFYGASNLTISATDIPNLTGTSMMSQTFRSCTSLVAIPNINSWNVSAVTNMTFMFADMPFNSDISAWQPGNVNSMSGMFLNNTAFNQDISGWDVSGSEHFSRMFEGATSFNAAIGGWTTTMLQDTSAMFKGATSFNQPIAWSQIGILGTEMFEGATSFNSSLSAAFGDIEDATEMFKDATAFNQDISGWTTPNLQFMAGMFQNATSFNRDIGSWNVSQVADMSNLFNGASAFNQNLGAWDVGNVTDMTDMFTGSGLSIPYYDEALRGWSGQSVQPSVTLSTGPKYTAQDERDILTNTPNDWVITDGGYEDAFVTEWNTANTSAGSSASNQVSLPLLSGNTYNFTVDWGDGSYQTYVSDTPLTHTYSSPGTYQVVIFGTFNGMQFDGAGDRQKLLEIKNWGPYAFSGFRSEFQGASNLTISATDAPSLAGTTRLDYAFMETSSLTNIPGVGTWDVSSITDFTGTFQSSAFNGAIGGWSTTSATNFSNMFAYNSSFNQNINGWNTAGVVDMNQMFLQASAFNQPLNLWNVSAVTNMTGMFRSASNFAQNLASWNTASVTNMSAMFQNATSFNHSLPSGANFNGVSNMSEMFRGATSFNQDISGWDVSTVSHMNSMFLGATAFNRDISTWDVSSVTNMSSMFQDATAFNRDLSAWDVSSVTNMSRMFQNATTFNQDLIWGADTALVQDMSNMFNGATAFNGDITNWTTGSVQTMANMFTNAAAFNQNISGWDTASVTTMDGMFQLATSFNQPVGSWDTSAVTQMPRLFDGASSFNQNISAWNVENVTTMKDMLEDTVLSVPNYDALLIAWSAQDVQTGFDFDARPSKYTPGGAAEAGRTFLTGPKSWSINDGGPASPPALANAGSQRFRHNVGMTYDFANTGAAAIDCDVTPGLPTGLGVAVNGSTCRISGTPTVVQGYSLYTVTATASDTSIDTATISIQINEPPVITSAASYNGDENQTSTDHAATATDPEGDTRTWSISGTDATHFNIDSSTGVLTFAAAKDFEVPDDADTNGVYALTLEVSDGLLPLVTQAITVTLNDVNDAPTAIGLSSTSVDENQAVNTVVGTLSSTDQDAGDTHTYTLVAGTGDADNASFNISGNNLRTSAVFNESIKDEYFIRVRSNDGNGGTFDQTFTITINDITPPSVARVRLEGTNTSPYGVGEEIKICVIYSEDVVLAGTGTPTLLLETGTTDRLAQFSSAVACSSLGIEFTYTVQANDVASDLDSHAVPNQITLNGRTLRDAAGNNAELFVPASGIAESLAWNEDIVVDGVVPTITSINSTKANGHYTIGEVITIDVNFSEEVFLVGTASTLTLNSGGTAVSPSKTAATTISYTYTVASTQTSADLNVSSLNLSSDTIRDVADNDINTTLPGSNNLANNKALVIDTTAPSIPSLATGTSTFSLAFNEVVSEGSPDTNFLHFRYNLSTTTPANCASGTVLTSPYEIAIPAATTNLRVIACDQAGNYSAVRSATYTFDDPPTKIVFTSDPLDQNTSVCGVVTAQTQDAASDPKGVTSNETVRFTINSGSGSFYSNSNCSTLASPADVSLTTGNHTATIYFRSATVTTASFHVEVIGESWTEDDLAGNEVTNEGLTVWETKFTDGDCEANGTSCVWVDCTVGTDNTVYTAGRMNGGTEYGKLARISSSGSKANLGVFNPMTRHFNGRFEAVAASGNYVYAAGWERVVTTSADQIYATLWKINSSTGLTSDNGFEIRNNTFPGGLDYNNDVAVGTSDTYVYTAMKITDGDSDVAVAKWDGANGNLVAYRALDTNSFNACGAAGGSDEGWAVSVHPGGSANNDIIYVSGKCNSGRLAMAAFQSYFSGTHLYDLNYDNSIAVTSNGNIEAMTLDASGNVYMAGWQSNGGQWYITSTNSSLSERTPNWPKAPASTRLAYGILVDNTTSEVYALGHDSSFRSYIVQYSTDGTTTDTTNWGTLGQTETSPVGPIQGACQGADRFIYSVGNYDDPSADLRLLLRRYYPSDMSNVASVAKLAFTSSPLSQDAGTCGTMTVQTRNAVDVATNVGSNTTINLTSTSGTGEFYAIGDCNGTPITSRTILSGTSSVSFLYQDSTVGLPTITADENPSQSWTSAMQGAAIRGITKIAFTSAALDQDTTDCGAISVQTQNAGSNPQVVATNTTINFGFTGGSGSGVFYSNAGCSVPLIGSSATLVSGQHTLTVYYRDTGAGFPTFSAAENPSQGWTDGSLAGNDIHANSPPVVTITSPGILAPPEHAGDVYTLTWTLSDLDDPVSSLDLFLYYRDDGLSGGCDATPDINWHEVTSGDCDGLTGADLSCNWTMPSNPPGDGEDYYFCLLAEDNVPADIGIDLSYQLPIWEEGKELFSWLPSEAAGGDPSDDDFGGTETRALSCTFDLDHNIYVGAQVGGTGGAAATFKRFNYDGSASWSYDSTLGSIGWDSATANDFGYAVEADASGAFYVAGSDNNQGRIRRHLANGTQDWSWARQAGGTFPTRIRSIALGSNDSYIYATGFTTYGGGQNGFFWRIDSDGTNALTSLEGISCATAGGGSGGADQGFQVRVHKTGTEANDIVWFTLLSTACVSGSSGADWWVRACTYDLSQCDDWFDASSGDYGDGRSIAVDSAGYAYVGGYGDTNSTTNYVRVRKFSYNSGTNVVSEVTSGNWAGGGVMFDNSDAAPSHETYNRNPFITYNARHDMLTLTFDKGTAVDYASFVGLQISPLGVVDTASYATYWSGGEMAVMGGCSHEFTGDHIGVGMRNDGGGSTGNDKRFLKVIKAGD